MAESGKIGVGDEAPDFTVPDQFGKPVRFSDMVGKSCIVLYFYPRDFTPGCTAEACAFRDSYDVFVEAGAKVLGISADPPKKHNDFAVQYDLPFMLLSDEKKEVRKLFGVPSSMGLLPGRVTYVIDRGGIVRHVFSSQLNVQKHIDEALEVLKGLKCKGGK